MDSKLFKSYSPPSAVKIKSSDSDKTVFEVMGVPYGGPAFLGGNDLQGERFTKSTDFGRDLSGKFVVDTIYSFYDHALNDGIGKQQIGFAKFFQETEQGQLWNIEVSKAYQYHDFIYAMAQANLLGASSQPVQTAVEIDDNGEIKRWPLAEISLTPTPANPNAVMQLMKSLNMEFKMEVGMDEELNKDNAEETNPETEVDETPDLADVIESAFNETPADAELSDVKSALAELVKSVTALTAVVAEIQTNVAKSIDNEKNLAVEIGKINVGLKSFALGVAKSLKTQVKQTIADLDKKSGVELELEGEVEDDKETLRPPVKSVIPANAPGSKRSNQ